MKKNFVKTLVILIFTTLAFVVNAQNENNFKIAKNLDIYTSLLSELNINYVDSVDIDDLVRTSIDEMLKKLDPYTFFISEKETDDFEFFTTGVYGGIGVDILQHDKKVMVGGVREGFSGHRAGLKTGDVFLEVDGKDVRKKTSAQISDMVKGKPGTPLTITVKRPGVDEPIIVNLKKETITVDNVPYYTIIDNNIGYILLSTFTSDAAKEVKKAFMDLKSVTELKGLILDLRGNGGGLMQEAVEIVNIFVDKGQEVVSTKGKLSDRNLTYYTHSKAIDTEIPLAVLINSNSASASEIVAGAIQDLDRGILIGQRSFGKGLVQNVVPLSYNSQLKVTTAKYYIPSGRCIQAIDYSHKDENGYFTTIPDSLISEFETKSGRKVYDGGGIEPDIKLKPRILSNISVSLYTRLLIFDYAVKYYYKNQHIKSVKDFEFTDKDYQSFLNYLKDKDYDYTTKCEKSVDDLIENAKKESYYEAIKDQLTALKKSIKHNKEEDLTKHKNEIMKILEMEIAANFFYDKGRIQVSMRDNEELKKATEILKAKNKYQALLLPTK